MMVVLALAGVLLLHAALIGSVWLGALVAARWLGLPTFRWFDERPPDVAVWKRALVRLVSALAPLLLIWALCFVAVLLVGTPKFGGGPPLVDVLEGAARTAGMRNGDRVVRLDGVPVKDWDQLRAHVARAPGSVRIEVERGGMRQELVVTPIAHRIGISQRPEIEPASAGQALAVALPLPFNVLRETVRQLYVAEQAEFKGPVGIAREVNRATTAGVGQGLYYLGILASYSWPWVAALHAFDLGTRWFYRVMHPRGPVGGQPAYRTARLRQLSVVLVVSWCVEIALRMLVRVDDRAMLASPLLVVSGASNFAILPLTWMAGQELWTRSKTLWMMALAQVVGPFMAMHLAGRLRRKLEADGFAVELLRARPQ